MLYWAAEKFSLAVMYVGSQLIAYEWTVALRRELIRTPADEVAEPERLEYLGEKASSKPVLLCETLRMV